MLKIPSRASEHILGFRNLAASFEVIFQNEIFSMTSGESFIILLEFGHSVRQLGLRLCQPARCHLENRLLLRTGLNNCDILLSNNGIRGWFRVGRQRECIASELT